MKTVNRETAIALQQLGYDDNSPSPSYEQALEKNLIKALRLI